MKVTTITRQPGSESQTILLYLRKRGSRYFTTPTEEDVDVRFVEQMQRQQSRIYRFELRAKDQLCLLRVKVPLPSKGQTVQPQGQHPSRRPRPFPAADPELKFHFECAALSAIQDYFENRQDPRFGSVRLLDTLPEIRANVMEEVSHPSLRKLFAKENRLQGLFTSFRAGAAFNNAGAWLRAYHSLPKQAEVRHTRRDEFLQVITELTSYLNERLADALFFRRMLSITSSRAYAVLPEQLPVGLGHGDYAMRNILVGSGGQVTVLDTLARWRTAIFEDIAYFLTNLKMIWPQVITQGLVYKSRLIQRYEREFLAGYFDLQQVPLEAIRLYEIYTLLDKWCGRVALQDAHARHAKRIQPALENRYFKRRLDSLLQAIGPNYSRELEW